MRVTQQDIARIANVSQATVSRVLAGDARVEEDIRQRVLVAIEDKNYRPDVRAQSLRNKQTQLIGLVVKRTDGGLKEDPFFALFISEIVDFLSETPYHLCVDMAHSASKQESVYDEMLRTRRVDGLILVESEAKDERIARLQNDRFPFVLVGNPAMGGKIASVDNDNQLAAAMATRHLINEGFKNIGMIAGPKGLIVSEDRICGYREAIEEADRVPMIWHSGFGLETARNVATEALKSANRPDALLILDDYMAMGVVQAARELGLAIPADLGLVSFNDTSVCQLVDGGLTSVSLNIPQIVASACTRLLDLIENNDVLGPRRDIVPCSLKVRGSSVKNQGGKS